nr:immunoglobulin heavy chain junction region [Macaca mulatta]MOX59629.1 immunoglobulin heavy chain junction region [Macaca mulatta]MOX59853.1 immunoglobulin heavy chain junction region [Macaca mulatta]MOX59924.1 immunoglobulin heavy chain junction region [Macaca mulatta]MOX60132.1 immunoglobulin heavy chain junction region [Macaca mulatta]
CARGVTADVFGFLGLDYW